MARATAETAARFTRRNLSALKVLVFGVLVGTGVRAAEWAIPAPELRVVVCTMSDIGKVETCTSAAALLKKHAG